jgi:hypothetical protein
MWNDLDLINFNFFRPEGSSYILGRRTDLEEELVRFLFNPKKYFLSKSDQVHLLTTAYYDAKIIATVVFVLYFLIKQLLSTALLYFLILKLWFSNSRFI